MLQAGRRVNTLCWTAAFMLHSLLFLVGFETGEYTPQDKIVEIGILNAAELPPVPPEPREIASTPEEEPAEEQPPRKPEPPAADPAPEETAREETPALIERELALTQPELPQPEQETAAPLPDRRRPSSAAAPEIEEQRSPRSSETPMRERELADRADLPVHDRAPVSAEAPLREERKRGPAPAAAPQAPTREQQPPDGATGSEVFRPKQPLPQAAADSSEVYKPKQPLPEGRVRASADAALPQRPRIEDVAEDQIYSTEPRSSASVQSEAQELYQITGVLSDRDIISRQFPEYPDWAAQRGIQARCSIQFEVTPDGRVRENAYILRSSGYAGLDRISLAALMQWRFAPINRDDIEMGVITFYYSVKWGGN